MSTNIRRVVLLMILVSGITTVILFRDRLDIAALQSVLETAGAAAPLIFIACYALATVLFFPGAVLTLLGGVLFGPVLGTIYNLTGATLGATLAFIVARYLVSDWVEDKAAGRLKQLKTGVEHEGWRFVAFTRLVPLFPFNLLNYAFGLTRIRVAVFSVASFIFMLPGAAAYTYLGYIGKEAATGGDGLIQKMMIALALLAVVVFLPGLIRRIRQASTGKNAVDSATMENVDD